MTTKNLKTLTQLMPPAMAQVAYQRWALNHAKVPQWAELDAETQEEWTRIVTASQAVMPEVQPALGTLLEEYQISVTYCADAEPQCKWVAQTMPDGLWRSVGSTPDEAVQILATSLKAYVQHQADDAPKNPGDAPEVAAARAKAIADESWTAGVQRPVAAYPFPGHRPIRGINSPFVRVDDAAWS